MGTTLLYVRHADVFNPENVLYGRLARFGLSDYGKYHAERAAAFLQDEPIVAFYTSPLLRARQTMRILARRHPGIPVAIRGTLAEVRSSWQGTAFHALPDGKTVYESRQHPADETIDDVWQRMRTLALDLVTRHRGQTVLCVSHGDPIKILTFGFKGRTLDVAAVRQPDPARCSVTRFVFTPPDALPAITYTDILAAPEFQRVASLADLALGSLTRIEHDHREVLLVRSVEGEVYALNNRCPHMRAHLHEGVLEGTVITCPLHGSQFQAAGGELIRGPQSGTNWLAGYGQPGRPLSPIDGGPLATYEVRVAGDDVLLRRR
ncbi:MAG: histidine phosphatase family protein [Chloroflexota bacterium]